MDKFLRLSEKEKEKKSVKILNAAKRSATVESLVINQSCAENFYLDRFKIIKSCVSIFGLIKMEAIWTLSRKHTHCRQNEFDYWVALFT